MSYRVRIKKSAQKAFEALHPKVQRQVASRIDELKTQRCPPGSEKLRGHPDFWRLVSGDYRVVFTLPDDAGDRLVVAIGNRKDVYRAF